MNMYIYHNISNQKQYTDAYHNNFRDSSNETESSTDIPSQRFRACDRYSSLTLVLRDPNTRLPSALKNQFYSPKQVDESETSQ